jgi:hypothetical protein
LSRYIFGLLGRREVCLCFVELGLNRFHLGFLGALYAPLVERYGFLQTVGIFVLRISTIRVDADIFHILGHKQIVALNELSGVGFGQLYVARQTLALVFKSTEPPIDDNDPYAV